MRKTRIQGKGELTIGKGIYVTFRRFDNEEPQGGSQAGRYCESDKGSISTDDRFIVSILCDNRLVVSDQTAPAWHRGGLMYTGDSFPETFL